MSSDHAGCDIRLIRLLDDGAEGPLYSRVVPVIRGTLLLRHNKWEIVPGDGPSTPRPDRKAGLKEVVIHAAACVMAEFFTF